MYWCRKCVCWRELPVSRQYFASCSPLPRFSPAGVNKPQVDLSVLCHQHLYLVRSSTVQFWRFVPFTEAFIFRSTRRAKDQTITNKYCCKVIAFFAGHKSRVYFVCRTKRRFKRSRAPCSVWISPLYANTTWLATRGTPNTAFLRDSWGGKCYKRNRQSGFILPYVMSTTSTFLFSFASSNPVRHFVVSHKEGQT